MDRTIRVLALSQQLHWRYLLRRSWRVLLLSVSLRQPYCACLFVCPSPPLRHLHSSAHDLFRNVIASPHGKSSQRDYI
eukprot:COSAG06_NODE_238_length_19422_cov_16.417741_6_plen_78_part_00